MFSRFTASARRVMQRAFREAKRWQHDFVGTEHLLYGLLCDADGPAVALLRSLDAKPELLLQKVELSLQRHDGGMTMEQFPLSPASKRVFRAAAEEAQQFDHQMIGQEHLLLGLLRDSDCEAAQILSAHSVGLAHARHAIAQLPPDRYHEAQVQADEAPRLALGDNPSADELERWIAPITQANIEPMMHDAIEPARLYQLDWPSSSPSQEVEAQLRRTQLVLGAVLGFAFGYWLAGWMLGSVLALAGFGVATFRSSWLGVFVGSACGLLIVPMFLSDVANPIYLLVFGVMGALLGSFLGDGWRFSAILPGIHPMQPLPPTPTDDEKANDSVDDRQQHGVRTR